MKKIFLLLFIIRASSFCYCQNKATIAITLENTETIIIEKTAITLIEQGMMGVDNRISPNRTQNYSLLKIDNQHYLLECLLNKSEIFFLNLRQILISPGDNIKLTYREFPKKSNGTKPSEITATGKNNANYTYSNFTNTFQPDKYFPNFDDLQYKSNSKLFYNDLVDFYNIYDKEINSLLTTKGCDRRLIDFIKREHRFSLLFTLIFDERKLLSSHNKELNSFSKLVDSTFLNYLFIPSDTSNTVTMEKVFKTFLERLVFVKFKQLNTNENFNALIKYIKEYPDAFMREYLIYYLVTDYNPLWKRYYSIESSKLIQNIKNKNISEVVQKYSL